MGSKYIMSSIQSNVKLKGTREICPWKRGSGNIDGTGALPNFEISKLLNNDGACGARTAGLVVMRAALLPRITLPSAATFQAACHLTLSLSHSQGAWITGQWFCGGANSRSCSTEAGGREEACLGRGGDGQEASPRQTAWAQALFWTGATETQSKDYSSWQPTEPVVW